MCWHFSSVPALHEHVTTIIFLSCENHYWIWRDLSRKSEVWIKNSTIIRSLKFPFVILLKYKIWPVSKIFFYANVIDSVDCIDSQKHIATSFFPRSKYRNYGIKSTLLFLMQYFSKIFPYQLEKINVNIFFYSRSTSNAKQ